MSIITGTPLCIIGVPGQSKTLSFQIVLQNLQGAQLSPKLFCQRLPAVDPFFCMGSKYTKSDDIAYVFERAIKREHNYKQNGIDTRCVSFIVFDRFLKTNRFFSGCLSRRSVTSQ